MLKMLAAPCVHGAPNGAWSRCGTVTIDVPLLTELAASGARIEVRRYHRAPP